MKQILKDENGIKYIAYENNGRHYFTTLENYNARIQDARKIKEVNDCENFDDFINFLTSCLNLYI